MSRESTYFSAGMHLQKRTHHLNTPVAYKALGSKARYSLA